MKMLSLRYAAQRIAFVGRVLGLLATCVSGQQATWAQSQVPNQTLPLVVPNPQPTSIPTIPGAIRSLAWNGAGTLLAMGGDSSVISLASASGESPVPLLLGHSQGVRALAWRPRVGQSASTELLASRGADGRIMLWDIARGEELKSFAAPSKMAAILLWSPDGKALVTDGEENSLVVLDAGNGKTLFRLSGHEKWPLAAAFSPDGKMLASAGADGTLRFWDWRTQKAVRVRTPFDGKVRAGDWLRALAWRGNVVAVAGDGGGISFWQTTTGKFLGLIPTDVTSIEALTWAPGKLCFAGSGKVGSVDVPDELAFDAKKIESEIRGGGKSPFSVLVPHFWDDESPNTTSDVPQVVSLVVAPSRDSVLAGQGNGSVVVWNWGGQKRVVWRTDTSDKRLQGALLRRDGLRYYSTAGTLKVAESLENALALVPTEWRFALDLADAYRGLNRFDAAATLLQNQLAAANSVHARWALLQKVALLHYSKAQFFYSRRLYGAAAQEFRLSFAGYLHLNDWRQAGYEASWLANAQEAMNRLEEAVPWRKLCLQYARRSGDRKDQCLALTNLARTYRWLTRYAESLGALAQALNIAREIKDQAQESIVLNWLGNLYYALGDQSRALVYYKRAVLFNQQLLNLRDEGVNQANIGEVYEAVGRFDMAGSYYRKALEIARRVKNRASESSQLRKLALVEAHLNRFDTAHRLAHQAVEIDFNRNDLSGASSSLLRQGLVYQLANQPGKALPLFARSRLLAHQQRSLNTEARALAGLMQCEAATGASRLAVFHGKAVVNLYQSIRANLTGLDNETQQKFLRSKSDTYRQLADILIGLGRLSEASRVMGLLKQQELFDFVRGDVSQSPEREQIGFDDEELSAQQQEEALWSSALKLADEQAALEALENPNFAQRERLEKVKAEQTKFEQQYTDFLQTLPALFQNSEAPVRNVKGEIASLQETLSELESDAGLHAAALYTLVSPDRYRVVFVGAHGNPVPLTTAISADELNRKVFAFREAIEQRADVRTEILPKAQELYRILFCNGELKKQLSKSGVTTLMWSLDGTLRYLPLAALHDGQKYLVERFALCGFTAGAPPSFRGTVQSDWSGLGVGVSQARTIELPPLQPERFQALPGVMQELKGIIRDDKAGDVEGVLPGEILPDEKFTFDSLKTALKSHPKVVHIATHFRLGARNAESYLLPGDGPPLTLDSIAKLGNGRDKAFSKVELVTLSACETALGADISTGSPSAGTGPATSGDTVGNGRTTKQFTGDGAEVESLATVVQEQGAKAVVATLWPVADASTATLMRQFYSLRLQHADWTKIRALQNAQLSLLHGTKAATDAERGQPRLITSSRGKNGQNLTFAHPYYWAPFVLMGDWR